LIAGTPTMVMILNSVLAGVIAAAAALHIGAAAAVTLGLAALGFVVAMVLQAWYASRSIAKAYRGYRPLFPSPAADP
jgi:hypothetical protein